VAAAEIVAALGGAPRSTGWWRSPCPVHGSRGATLALRDGKRGLIVKCWAGCDWQTRNGVNGRPLYSQIVGFVDRGTFDRFCNLVLGLNRAEFRDMLDGEGEP
jgi:hypothetical protein